jgi:hypothetical protein
VTEDFASISSSGLRAIQRDEKDRFLRSGSMNCLGRDFLAVSARL